MKPCGTLSSATWCCEFHMHEDEQNRQNAEAISNYRAAEIRRQDVLLEHGCTGAYVAGALSAVKRCRAEQESKYGDQTQLGPDAWLSVLAREFCEAGNEANEHYKGRARGTDKLRAELVDVAAVAVAWIESIDRKAAEE